MNRSCPVSFFTSLGVTLSVLCPYELFCPYTSLPTFKQLWFQSNGSLLGPSVSKHTVISHQHQSKLLWFSFSSEKDVLLYFPTATCSSLLSAAADIILSLQLPFSCFPLQSENFGQAVLFSFLKECISQAQLSLLCSSDVIGISGFGHIAFKNLEGLLQRKQKNYHILCHLYLIFISKHTASEILISGF